MLLTFKQCFGCINVSFFAVALMPFQNNNKHTHTHTSYSSDSCAKREKKTEIWTRSIQFYLLVRTAKKTHTHRTTLVTYFVLPSDLKDQLRKIARAHEHSRLLNWTIKDHWWCQWLVLLHSIELVVVFHQNRCDILSTEYSSEFSICLWRLQSSQHFSQFIAWFIIGRFLVTFSNILIVVVVVVDIVV